MTKSEEVILWQHHLGYVQYFPPMPLSAIKYAAKECGVTEERVKEVIKEHGSRLYPDADNRKIDFLINGHEGAVWSAHDKDFVAEV